MLVNFSSSVFRLNGKAHKWDELHRDNVREQETKYLDFSFSASPSKTDKFDMKLIFRIRALIENVRVELEDMCLYQEKNKMSKAFCDFVIAVYVFVNI